MLHLRLALITLLMVLLGGCGAAQQATTQTTPTPGKQASLDTQDTVFDRKWDDAPATSNLPPPGINPKTPTPTDTLTPRNTTTPIATVTACPTVSIVAGGKCATLTPPRNTLTSPPPTPTTQPTPTPQSFQFTPTGWYANSNKAIVQFRGTIRDEAGNPVNGYSVLVDNGSWRVLSHPTGASHHYPETIDGQWDVVLPDPRTGVGRWTLTVVRYEWPDFEEKFDAQCSQFTRLSEDIRIEVKYPDDTIIQADWTCHRDCDKGLYSQAYRRP